jgi:hypothetical protein
MSKNPEKNDDHIVLFKGIKLNKFEANRIGIAIFLGIIGVLTPFLIPGISNGLIQVLIILFFVGIGYFLVGPKLFKK